jgi:tRNA-specific 2-thiouridylase
LAEVNWLGDGAFTDMAALTVRVRIRSTRPPTEAILRPLSARTAEVELLSPEEGVSPGQACVFYAPEGSRVLGGGWITGARKA